MNEPKEIQCVHCKKMIPADGYGIHDCDPVDFTYINFTKLFFDNHYVDVVKVLEELNDG